MRKTKFIVAILLIVCSLVALVACGEEGDGEVTYTITKEQLQSAFSEETLMLVNDGYVRMGAGVHGGYQEWRTCGTVQQFEYVSSATGDDAGDGFKYWVTVKGDNIVQYGYDQAGEWSETVYEDHTAADFFQFNYVYLYVGQIIGQVVYDAMPEGVDGSNPDDWRNTAVGVVFDNATYNDELKAYECYVELTPTGSPKIIQFFFENGALKKIIEKYKHLIENTYHENMQIVLGGVEPIVIPFPAE